MAMNTDNTKPPSPDYGRRLLPTLIDERASFEPTNPFAAIPKSSDPSGGFIDISYRQFARAINRCSWWLEEKLGKARGFETIGYLAVLDLRYTILMLACVKVGYKVGSSISQKVGRKFADLPHRLSLAHPGTACGLI